MTSSSLSDSLLETLAAFDPPGAPQTTLEVADQLGISRRSTYERLERLVDHGELETKKAGANGRVWWRPRPSPAERTVTAHDSPTIAEPLVDDVLNEAEVGMFVLNDGFEVAWINDTLERYFGFEREQIVGQDKRKLVREWIAPIVDDRESFVETVLATYDDNTYTERFECHVRAGEGRDARWLEHRSKPIESGQYAGGRIELYYDITDRKRSEVARDKTEEQFQSLVDAVEEDAILRLDAEGHVVTWNEGAKEIKGYESEEILGEHVSTFYTEEDRAAGVPERNLERATEAGSIEDEGWRVRKDGTRFWANVTITAVRDEDGTPRGYLKITRDMTDRYEREQELESELQQVFERISDGFYAVDEEFRFTHVNERAEELLGRSEAELLGENVWEAFPYIARMESVRDAFVTAMKSQEATSLEFYNDNLEFWVEANLYPSDTGISVYFRDVTERKERERDLEETERLYQTLVENFPNGAVALVDTDRRYITFGGVPEGHVDVTRADIEGGLVSDLPETISNVVAPHYDAALEGETSTFEQEIDGKFYQFRFVPVRDAAGDIFAALGMSQDVTERKERERELAKYETIVETVNDGIYTVDEDGRFTMVNDAYVELTGYSREELLGSHVSLVVDEEIIERARGLQEAIVEGGIDEPVLEATLRTADGRHVPAEATFSMLPDDETERVGVARDITERKERERALAESERRYRTLVENFPNGAVGLFDDDLRYTAFGGELMDRDGVSPEDRIGNSVYDIYPDDIVEEVESYFEAALEGETNSFEVEYHDRNLFAYTLPVRSDGEAVSEGMLVVQDVTERREYQRRLEESNERLEQFAYAASHDLQEPLRMVTSYLQLIEDRYGDELDEDGEEFLEFAVDGAERMREMINALLKYSRVDTRGDPFEPVDLDDVLDDVREDLQMRIDESNAEITADALPRVDGDESQLRQVFQNLLSNAIEYSGDEPPRIDVSATRDDDQWVISVQDNGIGVDPDEQERIFEVFQRLHTHEEHSGTGIGLALSRRVVERHGGEIWVDSEPRVGSTLSFTLPARDT